MVSGRADAATADVSLIVEERPSEPGAWRTVLNSNLRLSLQRDGRQIAAHARTLIAERNPVPRGSRGSRRKRCSPVWNAVSSTPGV